LQDNQSRMNTIKLRSRFMVGNTANLLSIWPELCD
jgi:hypothetical protein